MHFTYIFDETTWDDTVRTLPLHHILQSWRWGAFKSRWGWEPARLLWYDGGAPVAAAQILRRAIPYTPLGIAYVSKGPLLDTGNMALALRVLDDLEREARRRRCLFIKIDPDVGATEDGFVNLLQGRGWRRGEAIQFPNTATVDLAPDEETLLAGMKSKTRYNIRLAERRGVEVRAGSPEQFELFYAMYAETARRDGFLIRPLGYYLDLWNDFYRHGLAHLLVAWVAETPVAGLILFRFGERAWYFYGASTEQHRRDMPTYALQWEAMRWAKAQGVAVYDLWGAPTDLDDPDDPMAGVWRFKEGFNAQLREQIGAWDYPVFGPSYRLYTEGIPRVRGLLSRAARRGASGALSGP